MEHTGDGRFNRHRATDRFGIRHALDSHIKPLKGLFLGLFFMAVGMSIDLDVMTDQQALIAGGVLQLLLLKSLVLVAVGRPLGGLPWRSALMLGGVPAMGGKFGSVVFAEALKAGQIVGRMLSVRNIPFTALETNGEQVDVLRKFGKKVSFGDPSRAELLRSAHADRAEVFVLTTDDPDANIRTAQLVKHLFPHLKVDARARNRQHASN